MRSRHLCFVNHPLRQHQHLHDAGNAGLAQATNTPLTLGQKLSILAIAMLTSKGASGVMGAGFVTLAATLAMVPGIPIKALAILGASTSS
ncbi:hypothetical protein CP49_18305 [Bradyrhizobium valentinum]|uniref:Uncharacterized protein n=1 Tax=Bradyrhizobium valentinum TaxID=1518501 RepID=A0A0R3LWF4_9BRAD|nr:hypothetical protein CP49_18305 [Bradyrhizobium valentinum]